MLPFLKINKSLVTFSLILILVVPIFGFKLLISFISNVLLLIFLIPLLILAVLLISLNSLKSKVNTCNQCGSVTLGIDNTCMNCGADLENTNSKSSENSKKPSETTIEVTAEEIK